MACAKRRLLGACGKYNFRNDGETDVFYVVLQFAMQFGLLAFLVAAFIFSYLMLKTSPTAQDGLVVEDAQPERTHVEVSQNRRHRPARRMFPSRPQRPVASLASVRIRYDKPRAQPVFGRKATS